MENVKLFDTHIHVGQFRELYESPKELVEYLSSVGVSRFAVSSTTICEYDYDKVIYEMKELQTLCGNRLIPVLWILPEMLQDGGLNKLMDSKIHWRCLKIHPQLHPETWLPESKELRWVVSMASILQCPLLIHTGEMAGCYPHLYETVIEKNNNVTFILAHGRPIDETICLMEKYKNVWTDTAFMPIENICKLCEEKLSERVLWGSDYPITKYYYHQTDMKTYYLGLIKQLKETINNDDFERITHKNFETLFGL